MSESMESKLRVLLSEAIPYVEAQAGYVRRFPHQFDDRYHQPTICTGCGSVEGDAHNRPDCPVAVAEDLAKRMREVLPALASDPTVILTEMTIQGLRVMGLDPTLPQEFSADNLREAVADFSLLKAKFIEAAAMLGLS